MEIGGIGGLPGPEAAQPERSFNAAGHSVCRELRMTALPGNLTPAEGNGNGPPENIQWHAAASFGNAPKTTSQSEGWCRPP